MENKIPFRYSYRMQGHDKEKELSFTPMISYDGQYLFLYVWNGTDPYNRLYYRKVESTGSFLRLLDEADASYDFVGNDGAIFYIQTNLQAPKGRFMEIDGAPSEREHSRDYSLNNDVIQNCRPCKSEICPDIEHAYHQITVNKDGIGTACNFPLSALC